MEKDLIFLYKLYLKNDIIIEEKVIFSKDEYKDELEVRQQINKMKKVIQLGFKENVDFEITINDSIFRGCEIIAIIIKEEG